MTERRIESVDAFPLSAPVDERFGYSQGWVDRRTSVLVRIEDSTGAIGWGECWGPPIGTPQIVNEFFRPRLLGRDPFEIREIQSHMRKVARAAYQSIVPWPALSGIDIALWDLKGRALQLPIRELIGGGEETTIKPYITGHYFKPDLALEQQFEQIVSNARRSAEKAGALKIKVGLEMMGHSVIEDIQLVEQVREAIGERATLMVDANYAYEVPTARWLGRELEPFDVYWFEEPVKPENHAGYASLQETLPIRIAGGECHPSPELHRLLDTRGVDVVQPDVTNFGGITPMLSLLDRAHELGIEIAPHVWGTPIASSASLQTVSAVSGQVWYEHDTTANPLRTEIAEPIRVNGGGTVELPEGPGLGVQIDEEAVTQFTIS